MIATRSSACSAARAGPRVAARPVAVRRSRLVARAEPVSTTAGAEGREGLGRALPRARPSSRGPAPPPSARRERRDVGLAGAAVQGARAGGLLGAVVRPLPHDCAPGGRAGRGVLRQGHLRECTPARGRRGAAAGAAQQAAPRGGAAGARGAGPRAARAPRPPASRLAPPAPPPAARGGPGRAPRPPARPRPPRTRPHGCLRHRFQAGRPPTADRPPRPATPRSAPHR
jgi:hypothetical protein